MRDTCVEIQEAATAAAVWNSFGPEHGALRQTCTAIVHSLVACPELNGQEVQVLGWNGIAQRMIVKHDDGSPAGRSVKVKSSKVKAVGHTELEPWPDCDDFFGPLPLDVSLSVARNLGAATVAAFSTVSRALRRALWLQSEAHALWTQLLLQQEGESALAVVRQTRQGQQVLLGPTLLRTAFGLRQLFRSYFEVVPGGVDIVAGGFEVVACPCIRDMQNVGVGAQGAIRRRAGRALEEAVQKVPKPVGESSVTLVPGGNLSFRVAMTVTQPPACFWMSFQLYRSEEERLRSIMVFLNRIHTNLFTEVRKAGLRSIAMPALCTGGIGIPVEMVAFAAVQVARKDFLANPSDPIRVRVACYESEHMPSFLKNRDNIVRDLFAPGGSDEDLPLQEFQV